MDWKKYGLLFNSSATSAILLLILEIPGGLPDPTSLGGLADSVGLGGLTDSLGLGGLADSVGLGGLTGFLSPGGRPDPPRLVPQGDSIAIDNIELRVCSTAHSDPSST
ncbi:unnamed protein product, partial [Adineta steineri]